MDIDMSNPPGSGRKPIFTKTEVEVLCKTTLSFQAKNHPLTPSSMREMAEMLLSTLSLSRQEAC